MITFASANQQGEVLEWLKRHAWKACSRQNWLAGSNPVLSANAMFFLTQLMKRLTILIALTCLLFFAQTIQAQNSSPQDSVAAIVVVADDSLAMDLCQQSNVSAF